jgi:hypothetical protein
MGNGEWGMGEAVRWALALPDSHAPAVMGHGEWVIGNG